MNELQRKEFEILTCFVNICNKLNLTYYLVCGSALGAVKYGGFIPWDDDIDVGLYREEYIIFCNNAQKFLPEGFFLQTHQTDKNYPNIFAKIRNCNTTYIEKSSAKIDMNHGVYIDVFPLDGYPRNLQMQRSLERKKLAYQRKLSCVFDASRSFRSKTAFLLRRVCGYHKKTAQIVDEYTNEIAKYSPTDSKIICNHGNWQGKLEYAPKEQYGDGVMLKFEGLEVRVPEKYDEYLTQKYGNWRVDPPPEQQVGHHYFNVCDLTKPYTEYIKKR